MLVSHDKVLWDRLPPTHTGKFSIPFAAYSIKLETKKHLSSP